MAKCRISVSIDGKNFFWIVVYNGILIKNPTKEDMVGTQLKYYNKQNICDKCKEDNKVTDSSILRPGRAYTERDKEEKETGRWLCRKCKAKYYYNMPGSHGNIIKSLRDCRTKNQDPNSANKKGGNSQELACKLYGWEDLNKKYDNYKFPIDCYEVKTGLYHQVQGHYYNSRSGCWPFSGFEREWGKTFEDMVCFCMSKDGKIVERIYKFPKKEIDIRKSLCICKDDSHGNPIISWYGKYRTTDEDVLKKANDIWKKINEQR